MNVQHEDSPEYLETSGSAGEGLCSPWCQQHSLCTETNEALSWSWVPDISNKIMILSGEISSCHNTSGRPNDGNMLSLGMSESQDILATSGSLATRCYHNNVSTISFMSRFTRWFHADAHILTTFLQIELFCCTMDHHSNDSLFKANSKR